VIFLLARIFIKSSWEHPDSKTRKAYGLLCGIVGVFLNLCLFCGKLLAGTISGSIAVTADAFNNLSDAGSSIVTLFGFKLAAKKPDPDHPYGHGRLEYVSGLLVALFIIMMGVELLKEAVGKIITPEAAEFSWLTVGILICSILVKFYMFAYNRSIGKKLDSTAMIATAKDSLSDCIATGAVLFSVFIGYFFQKNVDGYCGLLVSILVLIGGVGAVKDTITPLLGQPPEPEVVAHIQEIVLSHPEIVGIHDLIVHDYGPGRMMVTLHAEVPANGNILELHDVIDNAEMELKEELHCVATIHLDPIETSDEFTKDLKARIEKEVRKLDERLSIHDFRIVHGTTHTNILFDVLIPFESALNVTEALEKIKKIVSDQGDHYFPIINIDRPYVKH